MICCKCNRKMDWRGTYWLCLYNNCSYSFTPEFKKRAAYVVEFDDGSYMVRRNLDEAIRTLDNCKGYIYPVSIVPRGDN